MPDRVQRTTADLVLASDRGPVTFVRQADRLVPRPRPSSVTGVLRSAARSAGGRVAWVSTTTSRHDVQALASGRFQELRHSTGLLLEPVYVEPATYRAYYDGVGVRMLWFAHHDLWDDLIVREPLDPAAFRAYERVNRLVAGRVARLCHPRTLAVLHDYQLATAPRTLRRLVPGTPVAHLTHTPFATPASLGRLPPGTADRLIEGMLAADLLGFQRPAWAESFLACCSSAGAETDMKRGAVRHRGRLTWVRCYPTPVDPGEVLERGSTAHALRWAANLAGAAGRQVVRVDRLDPAKNVLRGFRAFELLLERSAELRGQVSFSAFLVPSRPGVAEYRSYVERTRREVSRINARFPGAIQVHDGDDRERALGALRAYHVLLVNPVRDGMNLVAQEGPLLNTVDGVVVLSCGAGAADLLRGGALLLRDPRDVAETAAALQRALALPAAERRRRAGQLRSVVGSRRPADWLSAQLEDLRAIRDRGAPRSASWQQPAST